jgi:Zn-dependent protease with chaperone function
MEKCAEIEYSGEGINITARSIPQLHRLLIEACNIVGANEVPAFSTDWDYSIGAFSVGEQHKRMVIWSGAVDLLNNDEQLFMIGHELGHMMCGHKTYHMLTEAMYMPIVNSDLKIWMHLIKMPLLNWYRYSDFTADRMGLLCCQDINIALTTMIKMAGLPKKFHNQANIEAFKRQAQEFDEKFSDTMDTIIKYLSINGAAMPWLVFRASELLKWYNSGEYNRFINRHRYSNIRLIK